MLEAVNKFAIVLKALKNGLQLFEKSEKFIKVRLDGKPSKKVKLRLLKNLEK